MSMANLNGSDLISLKVPGRHELSFGFSFPEVYNFVSPSNNQKEWALRFSFLYSGMMDKQA